VATSVPARTMLPSGWDSMVDASVESAGQSARPVGSVREKPRQEIPGEPEIQAPRFPSLRHDQMVCPASP
jgi:hypothetical protein